MRYAILGNARSLMSNPDVNLRHYSTVEEYHDAMTKRLFENNAASEHIDAGREPYLISIEAVSFSMHPFIEIHDIMIAKDDNRNIGLDIPGHRDPVYVNGQTLLAWRG